MRATPIPKRQSLPLSQMAVKIFMMGADYVQLVNQKRYSPIQ